MPAMIIIKEGDKRTNLLSGSELEVTGDISIVSAEGERSKGFVNAQVWT